MNDPLNWPSWRRDVALLSLGFYCMLGGGMTPILAAGFKDIAQTYHVAIPEVALTTGLYMMGLGLGSVVASPTAILYGKRPVYLIGIVLYIISAIWCALSPNYASLVVARIFMGFAVSPVECLPSATIAEIFFLHERAYRLGIYTLLLLSGKNLVPLASAAIIQGLSWRWVFWYIIWLAIILLRVLIEIRIVAMIVAFCFVLVFSFVPETFWDRTPRPSSKRRRGSFASTSNIFHHLAPGGEPATGIPEDGQSREQRSVPGDATVAAEVGRPAILGRKDSKRPHHVEFLTDAEVDEKATPANKEAVVRPEPRQNPDSQSGTTTAPPDNMASAADSGEKIPVQSSGIVIPDDGPTSKQILNTSAPTDVYPNGNAVGEANDIEKHALSRPPLLRANSSMSGLNAAGDPLTGAQYYTRNLRKQPAKSFKQTLRPWNGKLQDDSWFLVALRPFVLFAYPAILWSTLVYSLSIGWLIVLSESVSYVYQNSETYNFSSLGTGLIYISPFIGGILGTAVAGKVSDIIVRFMSRRNGGIYEPEFRLVMGLPVALSTCVGLMGFGWSAAEKDKWIVPTVFFGIISFGCALGSTTAITFAVDSYRQFAGEALVTLNFCKSRFSSLLWFPIFFCCILARLTLPMIRHLPWPRLLPVLQSLAGSRWIKESVRGHWRHPAGLLGNYYSYVYIWQEGSDVDCTQEIHGEVLDFGVGLGRWECMVSNLKSYRKYSLSWSI